MTDKEQALIAAAYRVAAEKCVSTVEEGNPLHIVAIGYSKSVEGLSPADAEAKLRELMVKVAERVSNIPRGKTYSVDDIVDGVLHDSR